MSITLPAEISKWVALALLVVAAILIIKAGSKIINVFITILLLAFCWFSFFTEEGAARLSIVFSGHPIIAYTTSLERQDDMSDNNTTYFISSKDVIVNNQRQEYIKCYTRWIVRIPHIGNGI